MYGKTEPTYKRQRLGENALLQNTETGRHPECGYSVLLQAGSAVQKRFPLVNVAQSCIRNNTAHNTDTWRAKFWIKKKKKKKKAVLCLTND